MDPSVVPRRAAQSKDCGTNDAKYYEGNVPLMEARFLELSSSIRALYRSVQELRDFLEENPQDDDTTVLMDAIRENLRVLRKQRSELIDIVHGMRQLNAQTEVPDDIRNMFLDEEKEEEEKLEENDANHSSGVYL